MYNSKNDFIIAGCFVFVEGIENISDETICHFNFSNKKTKKISDFCKTKQEHYRRTHHGVNAIDHAD